MFVCIAPSHFKCGRGDIRCRELCLWQFFGEGDGNAAGTGADVGDEKAGAVVFVGAAGAEFAESEAIEGDLDEMFGFRAGNQNVGSDFEGEAPEFLFASEMLDRYAGAAAIEEGLIHAGLFGGEFSFRMGIEIGAFALRGVEKK